MTRTAIFRFLARGILWGLTLGAVLPIQAKAEKVVISYWEKWSGFEADAMRTIIDDFNHGQDRIEVRFLSVSPIDVKLMMAASAGSPPDLAGLWSHSLPDFAEKGALTPLDDALAAAGLGRDHYVPIFWDLCAHRGFMWGLPTTPGCVALFYNKALFREAGLDPEKPPRTFAELEAASRRLTRVEIERGGRVVKVGLDDLTPAEHAARRYTVVQVGHLPQDAGMFVSAWGYWFGAKYYDGDRTILADDAGNVAAFQWMRGIVEDIGLDQLRDFAAGFGQSQSSQSPFLAGQAGMVLQGPWMKNFIEKYAPDLEWGVVPCPAAPGVSDDAPMTVVESDVVVIPRGAEHPREALEFMLYLQRQDVAEKLALLQRKFTALADVSPDFVARHTNPAIGRFIDLIRSPNVKAVPRLSIWREYDIEMTVASDRVRSLMRTPAEALAEVQLRVQWRFDRVMRRWDVVGDERLEEWREREQFE